MVLSWQRTNTLSRVEAQIELQDIAPMRMTDSMAGMEFSG